MTIFRFLSLIFFFQVERNRSRAKPNYQIPINTIFTSLPDADLNGEFTVCPLRSSLLSNTWNKNWVDFFFIKANIILI